MERTTSSKLNRLAKSGLDKEVDGLKKRLNVTDAKLQASVDALQLLNQSQAYSHSSHNKGAHSPSIGESELKHEVERLGSQLTRLETWVAEVALGKGDTSMNNGSMMGPGSPSGRSEASEDTWSHLERAVESAEGRLHGKEGAYGGHGKREGKLHERRIYELEEDMTRLTDLLEKMQANQREANTGGTQRGGGGGHNGAVGNSTNILVLEKEMRQSVARLAGECRQLKTRVEELQANEGMVGVTPGMIARQMAGGSERSGTGGVNHEEVEEVVRSVVRAELPDLMEKTGATDEAVAMCMEAVQEVVGKRLEKLEKRSAAGKRGASPGPNGRENGHDEYEKLKEGMDNKNRVMDLRLEKLERQLVNFRRRSNPNTAKEKEVAAAASAITELQGELTEVKAKLDSVATVALKTPANKSTPNNKGRTVKDVVKMKETPPPPPKETPANDAKLSDRLSYVEAQADGLEVAIRSCLETEMRLEESIKEMYGTKSVKVNKAAPVSSSSVEERLLSVEGDLKEVMDATASLSTLPASIKAIQDANTPAKNAVRGVVGSLVARGGVRSMDDDLDFRFSELETRLEALETTPEMLAEQARNGSLDVPLKEEIAELKSGFESILKSVSSIERGGKIHSAVAELGSRVESVEEALAGKVHGRIQAASPMSPSSSPVGRHEAHRVSSHYQEHKSGSRGVTSPYRQEQNVAPWTPPEERRSSHRAGHNSRGSSSHQSNHSHHSHLREAPPQAPQHQNQENLFPGTIEYEQHGGLTVESSRYGQTSRSASTPSREPREGSFEAQLAKHATPMHSSSRSPAGRGAPGTPRDLHEQLRDMQKDICSLSDRFSGVDPVEKAAKETLERSRIPIDQQLEEQKQQSELARASGFHSAMKSRGLSSYMSPSPMKRPLGDRSINMATASPNAIFSAMDKNQDGVLDRHEFANGLSSCGLSSTYIPSPVKSENMEGSGLSASFLNVAGTPSLPQAARPALQTDYLELRRKLLGKK